MPVQETNGLPCQWNRMRARRGIHLPHVVLLFLASVSMGCDRPADVPASEQAEVSEKSAVTAPAKPAAQVDAGAPAIVEEAQAVLEPGSGAKSVLETWDAVFMADTKVGSIHTLFKHFERDGQPMVFAESLSQLEVRRFGQTATMQTNITSVESRQGVVHAIRAETIAGPTPVTTVGIYRDGAMQLVTTSQGKMVSSQIPWNDRQGGFFALEQSLRRDPMKPGQKRQLSMLIPDVVGIQLVTADLTAETVETVELLEGTRQLLKIDMVTQIGNRPIDYRVWTTPAGDVLKTSIPALQQTVYRTSQTRAQKKGTGRFDLGWGSIVKIATPLPDPLKMTRAQYLVSLTRGNPAEIFASGDSQRVQSVDAHQARVMVLAVRPGSPVTGAIDPPPSPEASQPNSLIQSDDERVVAMAKKMVAGATDPWARSVALERGVHKAIKSKNFGQGFATAADVAVSLEGDCTEHAVLLAALCRAEGIPARVVLGLVYSRRDQGFAFHMWNEVWISERWIPLDATLGQGGIGAAYLKLVHTNLAQGAAEAAYVLEVINQLAIRVLSYQPS